MDKTFATRILDFYDQLEISAVMPAEVEVLNPYKSEDVQSACRSFYYKYYDDTRSRTLILGINPGRHGAGITGIPFTDPICLEEACGIPNSFIKRPELSAEFVYKLIALMGGPTPFYKQFYIGAVSPLGFTKAGKNHNYYDSPLLVRALKPFIIENLVKQIGLGIISRNCFVFGQGKNYEFLRQLNEEIKLFDRITPLPHPRWVMQYRRNQLDNILLETGSKLNI